MCGNTWRYRIATEIEKSCFFQLFFLVAMCGDTVSPQKLKTTFFFGGDTVSPQKLKNLVFFNFFFLVAMCGDTVSPQKLKTTFFFGGDTVSPQKLKNLVFFKFFFGWRCFFHENMSSGHRLVMLEGLDWNKTIFSSDW